MVRVEYASSKWPSQGSERHRLPIITIYGLYDVVDELLFVADAVHLEHTFDLPVKPGNVEWFAR